MNNRALLAVVMVVTVLMVCPANGQTEARPANDHVTDSSKTVGIAQPKFRMERLRGQVVWLNESLKKHFGVSTTVGAEQQLLAIETNEGQLLPILEDLRGRSFRTDARLRGRAVELLVRHYAKHPMLQVVRVFQIEQDQKFEVDYWCDVCAIVMFEKGLCACCQDQNRLRKRRVEHGVTAERD